MEKTNSKDTYDIKPERATFNKESRKLFWALGQIEPGQTVAASLSIGIALFPDHARDTTNLIQIADSAMYLAKRLQPGSRRLAGGDDPSRPDMESRIA